MNILRHLSVPAKIYTVVLVMAVVAAAVGGLGVIAMKTYAAKVDEIRNADQRALLSERINGLTLAVVMDSRGIYIAGSAAEVEKFGKPLLANLKLMEARLAEWAALAPPSERQRFAAAQERVREFSRFRTELVRIGLEQGAPAARAVGDNDANRANRQALNKELQALAAETEELSRRLHSELDESAAYLLNLLMVVGLGGLAAGVILSAWMARALIAQPIVRITGVMNALAAGDAGAEPPGQDSRDEIGAMARAVHHFRKQHIDNQRLRDEKQRSDEAAVKGRMAALQNMADTVEQESIAAVNAVANRTKAMTEDTDRMAASARRVAGNAQEVTAAAQQALSNAETVAAATGQLTSAVMEIGRQVSQAGAVTRLSVTSSHNTRQTIRTLSDSVQRIGDVAELIADIAAQTNLLALNATIEAARAGEAGKGFAVVAGEVKALANQTAKATEEISAQIGRVREGTDAAVAAVSEIGDRITQIDGISNSIAVAVEQQASATKEISSNVNATAATARQVLASITQVSTEAAGAESIADSMRVTADGMASSVVELQHALVRAVRTSTTEADRRMSPRYQVDLTGRVGGQAVVVRDLSEGGAFICGNVGSGDRNGPLLIAGFSQPLRFNVLSAEKEGLRVRFDMDANAHKAFLPFFEEVTQGRRPLAA